MKAIIAKRYNQIINKITKTCEDGKFERYFHILDYYSARREIKKLTSRTGIDKKYRFDLITYLTLSFSQHVILLCVGAIISSLIVTWLPFIATYKFDICTISCKQWLKDWDAIFLYNQHLLPSIDLIWQVQATLAALTFPIVISLMSLLIEKHSVSNIRMKLYLSHSGATLAGLLSIALVIAITIIYGLSNILASRTIFYNEKDFSSNTVIFALFGIWFLINIFLTARFLYVTTKFFDYDYQLRLMQKFCINRIFPQDLLKHLIPFRRHERYERQQTLALIFREDHIWILTTLILLRVLKLLY